MLSQNQKSSVIPSAEDTQALKDLIEKAKQGDAQSFEVIYRHLYTPLYRYVYSRTHHKQQAEDLCQQAFLKFYEALPRYEYREHDGSVLAYMFTIAKRLMINESVKKQSVNTEEEVFEGIEDENVDIMSEIHVRQLSEHINDYLHILSELEEEVIRLIYYGELSHKEVAAILDKEEAYIRKLKERALKKLRLATKHLHETL